MRVLVVDQDSSLLAAITQTLGEYFAIDAVTTKTDCLDLLRSNEFEVIVAGERLEDGSGLELLGQLGKHRPNMLRIFSADRERLKLLEGRLGPFGLFRTLSYPMETRQLLAALSAAGGADDLEDTDKLGIQARETRSKTNGVSPPQRRASGRAAQPSQSSPTPARKVHSAQVSRTPHPGAILRALTAEEKSAARGPSASQSGRRAAAQPGRSGSRMRPPSRAENDSLSEASRLAIAARARRPKTPGISVTRRSGFLVGAGVIVLLGGLTLAFKLFNASDDSVASSSSISVVRTPHFSAEVVKLVADTETAFQRDDFKRAGRNVRTLQQLAPNHPRLTFFEALLLRRRGEASGLERTDASHVSAKAPARNGPASSAPQQSSASPGSGTQVSRSAQASLPGPARPTRPPRGADPAQGPIPAQPSTSAAASAASVAAVPSSAATQASIPTFSGRTLEDSSVGGISRQPASPQTITTPLQRTIASLALSQEPRLKQQVSPEYPPSAADRGTEGLVDLSFSVSKDGEVTDVTVVHSEPSAVFDHAAIAAVRRWKYEPKTVNGIRTVAHLQLRLQFKLDHHGR